MPKEMVELRPIKESTSDYEKIEAQIRELFRKHLYLPLVKELDLPVGITLQNAEDSAVADGLRKNRITFSRGTFSGKFNAQISKELRDLGATFDRKSSTWKIRATELPQSLRSAVAAQEVRLAKTLAKIDKRLEQFSPEEITDPLDITSHFDSAIWKVEDDFQASVKNITLAPKLTRAQSKAISAEWQNNMKIWIKDFTESEIKKLRKEVKKSALQGDRYGSLIKTIQSSYGVSANKAKFLARQETFLLMTTFKETRYKETGIDEYKWGCVAGTKNHPVRAWHKALEGKTFSWDNPPVTTKPGTAVRRNNPGQDYNCRCFARPIVRFK